MHFGIAIRHLTALCGSLLRTFPESRSVAGGGSWHQPARWRSLRMGSCGRLARSRTLCQLGKTFLDESGVLNPRQTCIETLLLNQLSVRAVLDNLTVAQHQNLVGIPNRA